MPRSWNWSVLLATVVSVLFAVPLRAEYLVQPGDVLELNVAGIASMRQRLPVDTMGFVRLPLAGQIKVQGKNLSEINDAVQGKLASQGLPRVTNGGREYQVFLQATQISVVIAEYRPVYVSGDVATPGQHTFRPGMTARQVITLAGGHRFANLRTLDTVTASFDWQEEIGTSLVRLARENVRLQRIRAELANDQKPPKFTLPTQAIPPSVASEIVQSAANRFELNGVKHENEAKFFKTAVVANDARAALLNAQFAKEKLGIDAETRQLERLKRLAAQGNLTSSRLAEVRRDLLFAHTRHLQTASEISRLKSERAELNRQLRKLKEDRRDALLVELQESVLAIDTMGRKISALREKLAYSGNAKSFGRARATITITRLSSGKAKKITVDEDQPLKPGDVVDIVVDVDTSFGSAVGSVPG